MRRGVGIVMEGVVQGLARDGTDDISTRLYGCYCPASDDPIQVQESVRCEPVRVPRMPDVCMKETAMRETIAMIRDVQ